MANMTVTWNGKKKTIKPLTSIEDIIGHKNGLEDNPVLAARVNNKIRELCYIPNDGDEITTLDLTTNEGNRAYQRGLLHMFVRACHECMPKAKPYVHYSMGAGLYCEFDAMEISPFDVDRIGRTMRRFVNEDEPFVLSIITKEQAIDLYRWIGQQDKARLLGFRQKEDFKIYSCGNYRDYFYGHMPPSTGYLQRFQLVSYNQGIVLLFPQTKDPLAELEFEPQPKLWHVFRESERWVTILGCDTVADLDEMVLRGNLDEFVLINEARHDKEISSFASAIIESGARVVLIAGPSSSGKTTFTQRLRLYLRVNGKNPIMISLDNYYLDRDKIQPGPDGKLDLEDINTLNLALFNDHMTQLLKGKEVEMPRFEFAKGKCIRSTGRLLKLGPDDIMLIEGIHGLNDMLTRSIPRADKFKIYISALTQLNLDRNNRIPTTDVRLIRRMVRDYKHRGASIEHTLEQWPSVRAGEDKWIFPFQEHCDIMFNSTLVYELLYLKKYAYPLLKAVDENTIYFAEANRLVKFLNYFIDPGDEAIIPCTSLLREFIGGGVFEH